jgi:protein-glutamine gamma-glutamyltransferase
MLHKNISFNTYFKLLSFVVVFSGLFSLFVSGSIGVLSAIFFLVVLIIAWFLENSRWQISERIALGMIFLAIPIFYLDWKFQLFGGEREQLAVSSLSRLILTLGAIKLLQRKADRDWIFLYIIAFFEILLAAGVSISPTYIASLALFLLFSVLAIIAFEIKKTSYSIKNSQTSSLTDPVLPIKIISRLPFVAVLLLLAILIFAIPTFFFLPRFTGAGMGSNFGNSHSLTGFSDRVTLGDIGKIQQSDEIVMRVKVDNPLNVQIQNPRWRGVALDQFDNKTWTKTVIMPEILTKENNSFFRLNTAKTDANLVTQTVYLESVETSVLFNLSKPIQVFANYLSITKDKEDSYTIAGSDAGITSYKIISDVTSPKISDLKSENPALSDDFEKRYVQLPKIDSKISVKAKEIIEQAKASNRYDKAKAVETYLQNNFAYTLDLKVGTDEPIADFLFNIKSGHCEYFATSMAVMLRTQGIASRIVNGFQQGEYNETADVFVVKQRNAHSWVEVYFPEKDAWITFDPTPFAGQNSPVADATFSSQISKYLEGLESIWIQYFVSYDKEEQRSLAKNFRNKFSEYQVKASVWLIEIQNSLIAWWKDISGEQGFEARIYAIIYAVGIILTTGLAIVISIWFGRGIWRLRFWRKLWSRLSRKPQTPIIEFYQRMIIALDRKGYKRELSQTPLEFALSLNMSEAVKITEHYNRVRFGEKSLSGDEQNEIESWLISLEEFSEKRKI